jgi:hypothetical protein
MSIRVFIKLPAMQGLRAIPGPSGGAKFAASDTVV